MKMILAGGTASPLTLHNGLKVLAGVLVSLMPVTALGQPTPKQGGKPSTPPAATTPSLAVELGDQPFRLESAGLSMFLPVDATAQSTTIGEAATVQVIPATSTWLINIQTPRSSNPETTPAQVADQVVTQHFKNAGEIFDVKPGEAPDPSKIVAVKGNLIEPRKAVSVNGQSAERVYFAVPGAAGGPAVVRGLTVFKTTANKFVTFELVTTEPQFAAARRIYETVVATATFEDSTALSSDRAGVIMAGTKVIEGLRPEAYEAVLAAQPERWERLYKPAPGGADADATEIGYRRIRTHVGTRAELVGAGGGRVGDRQEGYIVQMDARILDRGLTYDSNSVFFMSPDRNDEAWTIRNAIRKDRTVDQFNETGARSGVNMSVKVDGTGRAEQLFRPTFQREGYLSRVEAWLLPQLLIRAGVEANFGFYSFQSDAGLVRLRRDSLDQLPDRPGVWQLTTKLGEDKPAQVGYFNEKGEHIRTEMHDGSVWEPVTIEKLGRLWKSKGLPMD